jgi:hypothetical protein
VPLDAADELLELAAGVDAAVDVVEALEALLELDELPHPATTAARTATLATAAPKRRVNRSYDRTAENLSTSPLSSKPVSDPVL